MKLCIACQEEFAEYFPDNYVCCENCGTYQYISNKTAEDENAEYFEKSDIWSVNVSSLKKVIFIPFRIVDSLVRQAFIPRPRFNHSIKKYKNNSCRILEIGFGNGRWLAAQLQDGFNAWGIDLSGQAVRRFQHKYPEYKDRVKSGTRPDQVFDFIYANAIFEHLDNADDFISHLNQSLSRDGTIQLGIPTVISMMSPDETDYDINFWKPCHRAIYSVKGLDALLKRHSLKISARKSSDPYLYRIMNQMLKLGYTDIHYYRTPFYSTGSAPGILLFLRILTVALFVKSHSMWSEILITKTL